MAKDFMFFKGCTIPVKIPNVERLTLDILPKIGINLEESDDFSCCPDPIQFQGANQNFWYATAARNLAIAEEKGKNIMTLCNGCLNTLAIVNDKMKNNAQIKSTVNNTLAAIGKEYKGMIEVKHFLQVIKDDIGIDKLNGMIKKPLKGLKVAGHPGCHLLMPSEILNFDDPVDPKIYDKFIEALGAEAIDYVTKIDCCGVSLSLAGDQDATNACLKKKLVDMKNSGAEVISTGCPFCFNQFDMGQLTAARAYPELKENKLPVLFAVELLALAMGKTLDDIGYNTHRIRGKINI